MSERSGRAAEPDRLTALDTAFLHIERPGLPIHIASVGVFDGGPLLDDEGRFRLAELRAQVEARLDALPRFRRRVAWAPLGLTRPCWVDDAAFDVAEHVDAVDLGGADDDDLRRYAEQLIAEPLPDGHPLWHLRFVTGLSGGRVGLVERVHHALADGVSGVELTTVILDLSPEVPPTHRSAWRPQRSPSLGLVLDGLRSQARAPLRLLRSAVGALARPATLARQGIEATVALGTMVGEGFLAPRSPLNVPIGEQRQLAWISTRLDEVKEAGRQHDATANDVVLAAVAHGLRTVLLERGEVLSSDDVLKVLVPVSLRDEGQHGTLGNRVGALFVRLPIGISDPVERLRAIARTTRRLKARREATTTDLLLTAADLLPAPLLGRLARTANSQRFVNVVVTNIPGPATPLYCRGARLLEAYPVVPLAGNLSVGVAILSYDGALNLTLTADPIQVPDLDVLRAGIVAGFDALTAGEADVPRVDQATPAAG